MTVTSKLQHQACYQSLCKVKLSLPGDFGHSLLASVSTRGDQGRRQLLILCSEFLQLSTPAFPNFLLQILIPKAGADVAVTQMLPWHMSPRTAQSSCLQFVGWQWGTNLPPNLLTAVVGTRMRGLAGLGASALAAQKEACSEKVKQSSSSWDRALWQACSSSPDLY